MVSDSVSTISLTKNKRVNNVAQRLGHLLSVECYPAVYSKMLRQWKIKCHKHCRPNDSVESHDILCYHVNVSRPELVKIIVLLVPETKCRNIVRKCVYPNVNNVLVIKCNRNTPLESSSRYTKILKTGLDKVVYKFSGSCLWLEIICLSEKLLYPLSK